MKEEEEVDRVTPHKWIESNGISVITLTNNPFLFLLKISLPPPNNNKQQLIDKEIREGKPDDTAMRQQIVDLLKDLPPVPTNETMDAGDDNNDEEDDDNVENGDEDGMDEED